MTVYLILAGLVLTAASGLGGILYGINLGYDRKTAEVATHQQIADAAADKVANRAADAISAIEITNKTIYSKATHEVRTNTVFADCVNTDSMHALIVEALRNGKKAADKSGVPGSERPAEQGLRVGGSETDRGGRAVLQVPGSGTR